MKLTISVSGLMSDQVSCWVQRYNANPSLVVEAALFAFHRSSDIDRAQLVRELQVTKKAKNRSGWLSLFWEALAEAFGATDFDRTGRQTYTVRQYKGWDIIPLLQDARRDDGRIHLHVTESPPVVAGIETVTMRYEIALEDSPFRVARQIQADMVAQRDRVLALRRQRVAIDPLFEFRYQQYDR